MMPGADQRLVDEALGGEQHAQGEGAQDLVHPVGNDERQHQQAHLLRAAGLRHVVGERIADGEVEERHERPKSTIVKTKAHIWVVVRPRRRSAGRGRSGIARASGSPSGRRASSAAAWDGSSPAPCRDRAGPRGTASRSRRAAMKTMPSTVPLRSKKPLRGRIMARCRAS